MQKSLFTLSVLGLTSFIYAARNDASCAPTPPVCYPEKCEPCYCLGPDNFLGNAPVCPKTCNGDFIITVAGFYWNAHQDGMEYAINTKVPFPGTDNIAALELNNLIDATYKTPNFQWDFGFKIGLGYCTTCDGWDINVLWTWYRGRANDEVEAERDDNQSLVTLWSAFDSAIGGVIFATDIETHWKLELNLVDIELGRQFWTSRYLSIRPHVGLRIAFIKQDWEIDHAGGSWAEKTSAPSQPALNNEVDIKNDFKGVGLRSGLDSEWNLGCGWALYGNFALSIVYGKFSVDHDEENREAAVPHTKTNVLDTETCFRASRGMLDLALGVQWSSMFCDCSYGITGRIGWEQHLFFHQNQMWRVVKNLPATPLFENVYQNTQGTLDTQGWTLTFKFEF